MLKLKKIRWKNLCSYGNQFQEFDLSEHQSTIISGMNGGGKSTLLAAIHFAVYGRPYQKIKLGQLVNSINDKDLVVELELEQAGSEYLVRRGLKPSIFEIYKDGILVPQLSTTAAYQELLEQTVIGMSSKTFQQVCILGANFSPFMKLSAEDRRGIIEDLLDIEVFSVMKNLLKERNKVVDADTKALLESIKILDAKRIDILNTHEAQRMALSTKIKTTKDNSDKIQSEVSTLEVTVASKAKELETLSTSVNAELVTKLSEEIAKVKFIINDLLNEIKVLEWKVAEAKGNKKKELEEKIASASARYEKANENLTSVNAIVQEVTKAISDKSSGLADKLNAAKASISKLNTFQISIKQNILMANADIEFFNANTVCPTCQQDLDAGHKQACIGKKESAVEQFNLALNKLEVKLGDANAALDETTGNLTLVTSMQSDLNTKLFQLNLAIKERDASKKELDILTASLEAVAKSASAFQSADFEQKIAALKAEITPNEFSLADLNIKLTSEQKKLGTEQGLKLVVKDLMTVLTSKQEVLKVYNQTLFAYNSELTDLIETNEKKLKTVDATKAATESEYNSKKTFLSNALMCSEILKDDGIRAQVINLYLPIINQTINKYLEQMNLPVSFTLDSEFNEVIRSRYRDKFTFESFSEGEKSRINLAILLTWRHLAKLRNSISCNLLILDEVFDGSMDYDGSEALLKILCYEQPDTNVIFITHKSEMQGKTKIDRYVTVNKNSDFSKMEITI